MKTLNHILSSAFAAAALIAMTATSGIAFDFAGDNQNWYEAGIYDAGGLTRIANNFWTVPARWLNDAGDGVSLIGTGGYRLPDSPTGDTYVHWDLGSPDLSLNAQWQNITSFSYEVDGSDMASTRDVYVQAVLNVRKPDASVSYFTDRQFHLVPTAGDVGAGPARHTVDVTALGMPAGTTILRVNLRFFFEARSGVDGFIHVDDVNPVGIAPLPYYNPYSYLWRQRYPGSFTLK